VTIIKANKYYLSQRTQAIVQGQLWPWWLNELGSWIT
jgi:hypothetical protein